MDSLKEKLHHTKLHDAKVKASHLKHKIGKLENLFNPNHRHDEAHEQEVDQKRTAIAESHRFQSFAPEHDGNKVKWYVDASDYMWAVSVALDRAKETIYIADWWLSPELFMRRPPNRNQEWRLDQILKRRAEAGVQIYVIVYKEVEQALTCNSAHTKHALRSLCPQGSKGAGNIHVLRHPDHNMFENLGDMTFYWAHHEKFVVIDYAIAFIGGIDLCFGRWDNHQHPLADVHPAGIENEIFPGQDFNNNRIMDFQSVQDWQNNELNKTEYGRMPWHDVAVGVIGDCVYDIAEHFALRWNCVKRDKYKRDESVDYLLIEGRTGEDEGLLGVQRPKFPCGEYIQHPLTPLSTKPRGEQGTVHAQIVRSSGDWSSGILTEHSIQNAYSEIIKKAEHFVYIENQFFVTATGDQQKPVENTIGRAIVEAVVRAGKEGRKFRVIIVIPCIPGFAGDLRENAAAGTRAIMDYQYKSILRGDDSIFGQIKAQGVDPTEHIFFFNLRSYDRINKTAELVEQEQKSGVHYQDIQRANAEQVMGESVHPGIGKEGDFTEHEYGISKEDQEKKIDSLRRFEEQREQAYGKDREIKSSDNIVQNAMLNQRKVSEEYWGGDDPEKEKDNFIQEELYVHGKVCIVDDRVVICGSANINDRSQLGDRDSELAIVLEDTDMIDSTMNGQPYRAARLAATLRRHLWREHLGLLLPQELDGSNNPNAQPPDDCPNSIGEGHEYEFVTDPLSEELWETWTTQATTNTEVFRFLFRADPDDHIKTFEDYDQFAPRKSIKQGHLHDPYMPVSIVRENLDKIRGHLVWMPLDFLKDAEMAEPGLSVNHITVSIYT
ncbi:phospholipase PldA, putative [Talaromyces stipitatus ATCC 10500]|uniref:phospholipase D n=1 Tax=Talaromyces stipitatus (strain ATCC 10500 / CBS 375.48 / QM 6759 / NRRL 1006) TaxID=441959 RepID=B8MIS1_TALSN|nr:phospholipase PldA, putative [Talaromyces stipitatus ATCC 10500]EED15583.1 phospholipase PldA, putative [Talaromyces stipitatus ATCC 10500]